MSSSVTPLPALYTPPTPLALDDPTRDDFQHLCSLVRGIQPCTAESMTVRALEHFALHQMWGKPEKLGWSTLRTISTGTEKSNRGIPGTIFMFAEYLDYLFPRVKALLEGPRWQGNAIVIGTPGIGKTMFLYAYLLLSLAAKRTVLFYEDEYLYLHGHTGAHFTTGKANIREALDLIPLKDVVLLVDMDGHPNASPVPLDRDVRHLRVVAASSPEEIRYNYFLKGTFNLVVMNPPTRDQLKMFYKNAIFTHVAHPREENGRIFDFDTQFDTGISWVGFSLRDHYDFMCESWSSAAEMAKNSIRSPMSNDDLIASYRATSRTVFGDHLVHVPCSMQVYSVLRMRAMLARKEYHDLFVGFFRRPCPSDSGVPLYGIYAHEQVFNKALLEVTLQHGETMQFTFQFNNMQEWTEWIHPEAHRYYVPFNRVNATFDSFAFTPTALVALQMTRLKKARTTTRGIEKLKKILSRAPDGVEPSIYLIFLVPHDDAFTYPAAHEGIVYGVARIQGFPGKNRADQDLWERLRTQSTRVTDDEDESMTDGE